MFKRHALKLTLAGLAALVVSAVGVASVGATGAGRADSGTAYVAVTHSVGSTLYAAGNSTDSALGSGAVTYMIKAGTGSKPGTIKITAPRVTVFSATGSVYGTSVGTETTNSDGTVSLKGTLTLNHGTGAQKGHSFIGTFTGTGKTATGPFVFHTKGHYK